MHKYTIANVTWHEDQCGAYWSADLLCDGKKAGGVGSFYDVDGRGEDAQRQSREVQEEEVLELLEKGIFNV